MEMPTQVLTTKVGPCGGGLYGVVKDMNINGITRIVKISINHSSAIDALTITFLRNGCGESTTRWGRRAGTLTEFQLETSEYITSVKGRVGYNSKYLWISSLTFETNLRSFGPYGKEDQAYAPFELPAMRGQIIGFHALAGDYLYAVGVYVQEPLAYTPQSTNAATIPSSLVCSNFSRMASTHEVLTKKVGPCGGISENAGTVKDMNIIGITHIVKISIHHSSVIDALTITFLRNGREESTEQWGRLGGTLTEFHLQASEYITSIKGHIGIFNSKHRISSLKFETNMRSFGPYGYGREEGYAFELTASMGQIIGFHAYYGESLYALGVYVQDRKGSVAKELEDYKQIENLEKEKKLQQTEFKNKEAEYLKQLQGLSSSKDDLQKKLESKIENLENKKKIQKIEFKNKEAEYFKQLQGLISSKEDLQKKLESKIEHQENEKKSLQTEFKNTEAEHLMHSQELRAELDSKNDLQKKLESKIEYLENENELLHTKLKHIEVEYLMHSQELRAELDYNDDLQKKLESKIMDLENENELMQTKEKDLKDAIKELLQSRERFVHYYQVDNTTDNASDGGNIGISTGTDKAGTK